MGRGETENCNVSWPAARDGLTSSIFRTHYCRKHERMREQKRGWKGNGDWEKEEGGGQKRKEVCSTLMQQNSSTIRMARWFGASVREFWALWQKCHFLYLDCATLLNIVCMLCKHNLLVYSDVFSITKNLGELQKKKNHVSDQVHMFWTFFIFFLSNPETLIRLFF